MVLQIVLILNFVYYLNCEDMRNDSTTLKADPGMQPLPDESTRSPGVHIDSQTFLLIIIGFIVIVCILSSIALLFGFKRGKISFRRNSEKELNEKSDSGGQKIAENPSKGADLKQVPNSDDTTITIRSNSEDDLRTVDKKKSPPKSVASKSETEMADTSPEEVKKLQSDSSEDDSRIVDKKKSPPKSVTSKSETEMADTSPEEVKKPQLDSIEENKDIQNNQNNKSLS